MTNVQLQNVDNTANLSTALLYQCCPYIGELKVLARGSLSGFKPAKRESISVEKTKVKEVSKKAQSGQNKVESPNTKDNMQDTLVANFFHNQPASVKLTVDSIIKSVINNFARKLQYEVIPTDSKAVLLEISANLKILCQSPENLELMKDELLSQVDCMAQKSHVNVQGQSQVIVEDQLSQRVAPSLQCLLPDDTKESVIKFCTKIIEKRIKQEANEWMLKNFPKSYFVTLFKREFEKLWNDHVKSFNGVVNVVKQTGVVNLSKSEISRENVVPIYQILIDLKSQTSRLNLDRPLEKVTAVSIIALLDTIQTSFALECLEVSVEDKAILDGSVKGVEHLTFDWILSLSKFFL